MAERAIRPCASVVIPVRDAGPGFQETLEEILAQSLPGNLEVIVIDSGSQDGTVELCRRYPVRLIQIPPASFRHGTTRNQAIGEAQGEFVALTVQDAVPADEGWLQALVQPMIDDPQVAGVYGRQVPRPGASYLAQQRNRLWYGADDSRIVQELGSAEEWHSLPFEERRALTRFDNVTSCLRRAAWQEIPFPSYNYAEDVGWARCALEAGYRLVYEPSARVCHSHDRDLAYEFQRAYIDARNTASILDAPLNPLAPTEARYLLGWLGDQARSYLTAADATEIPPSSFGQTLSQASAHWTMLGASELSGRPVEATSLDSALKDEAWHRERFDTAVVKHLLGPDSPYPAEERQWLLDEIGWLQAGAAQERALYRAVFDAEAAHYLLGPGSPRTAQDRAWLAGKLQLWGEDDDEAKAQYQARFDAECMAYLLGPRSVKSADEQAWLVEQLDRLEQEQAGSGPQLGRRLSQRLMQPQPGGRDVARAFGYLWDEISRDYAREAVNVRFLQTSGDLAHLFDHLWALGAPDLVKEAIGRSLRARIEAALAGERSLAEPELDFAFYNLWTRLGQEYIKGAVTDLMPETEKAHNGLVKELCTAAWSAGELTREIVRRVRLYAAAAITARNLGLAARTALAPQDTNTLLLLTGGTQRAGIPMVEPEEAVPFWDQVQALLDQPEQGSRFWAGLDKTLAQELGYRSRAKQTATSTSNPRVSVILRTRDEEAYLGQVIQGLLAQEYDGGLEIVVVDSGSGDHTIEIAQSYGCRLIEISPQEFSFGRALNIGAAEARGELLVNLSGHAVPVDSAYLHHLTAPFEAESVWATFGRDVPQPGCCPSQARDIQEWFPNEWIDRSRYFSNANACLRKVAWEAFPFDEELTGAEDAKWAQEVLAAGYQILYVPIAAAYHSHTASPRFVHARAVRETKALKRIEPARAQVGVRQALRFWLGVAALDYRYAWRHRVALKWYLHIPVYRAFQAWGLYQGSR